MDIAIPDTSQTVAVHRILLDLALQNRGSEAMLSALARLVNFPVVLFDSEGQLLACSDENARFQAQDMKAELDWSNTFPSGRLGDQA